MDTVHWTLSYSRVFIKQLNGDTVAWPATAITTAQSSGQLEKDLIVAVHKKVFHIKKFNLIFEYQITWFVNDDNHVRLCVRPVVLTR